jgi:excinuclease ABC subunit C
MKDAAGRVLYVGKAGNLRRRVASYFSRAHDARIEKLVSEINRIEHRETETVIEALVLEAALIKELRPPYNIKEKDDKSFLFVEITGEEWPRVILVRGKDRDQKREHPHTTSADRRIDMGACFGPFTSASSIREALKILRRIFPYNTLTPTQIKKYKRPCLDYELGLCPGACAGRANKKEYSKTLRHLKLFFTGGKKKIIASLKKEMSAASRAQEYERAEKLKRQIFALEHIQDAAIIGSDETYGGGTSVYRNTRRIEGYDISNISGTSAVGSMVVFTDGVPDKSQYRKFKIKTVCGANDVAMLREVLTRRLQHSVKHSVFDRRSLGGSTSKWPLPQLILIDGGLPQVNAARAVLAEFKLNIPLVGLAKGPDRKKNALVGDAVPKWTNLPTLIRLRDEAHRFAITYHRRLRGKLPWLL